MPYAITGTALPILTSQPATPCTSPSLIHTLLPKRIGQGFRLRCLPTISLRVFNPVDYTSNSLSRRSSPSLRLPWVLSLPFGCAGPKTSKRIVQVSILPCSVTVLETASSGFPV